jgi:transposase
VNIRLRLSEKKYAQLLALRQQAEALGQRRLVKRIETVLWTIEGQAADAIAVILGLSERCVQNYVNVFIRKGLASLQYRTSPGRPAKLTKTQKEKLQRFIDNGPEAAGYDQGCWTTGLIQDLIWREFKVEYNPYYLAELLKNLGYSYQKARFVSEHLGDVAAEQKKWMQETWPEILRLAREKKAKILFGDEMSCAQWGSLSYTWARRGHQPTVKTSGKRKAYKVWGFIEYFSGAFHSMTQTGKLNAAQYQRFLLQVLKHTRGHLIIIQDGASYHTSQAMEQFFAAHAERLTVKQLPAYSPDFNPIEYLWRKLKKEATHLRYFPTFEALVEKVDTKLRYFAHLPSAILGLLGKYCENLGDEIFSASAVQKQVAA